MGLNIKWDITYKCNLFCKHCINGELLSNSNDELETLEVFNIIDKISSSVKIDYIHFWVENLHSEKIFPKYATI